MIRRFITWLFLKGGDIDMMAMFFARRVILGKTDYKTVPTILQFDVKEISTDSRLKFLIVV
jgi:hypothetical protein